MTIHIQEKLQAILGVTAIPCEEAAEWAQGKTIPEIWATCDRGDWLLWWCQKRNLELRKLTAAKAACAEFARPYMKDARSIAALDMAHAYGRGECSADDLAAAAYSADAAAAAAYSAAYSAYYSAAAAYYSAYYAAYSAAAAADAAADAAAAYSAAAYSAAYYSAASAAYSAYSAAADAAAVAAVAKKSEILQKCADEVRRLVTLKDLGYDIP